MHLFLIYLFISPSLFFHLSNWNDLSHVILNNYMSLIIEPIIDLSIILCSHHITLSVIKSPFSKCYFRSPNLWVKDTSGWRDGLLLARSCHNRPQSNPLDKKGVYFFVLKIISCILCLTEGGIFWKCQVMPQSYVVGRNQDRVGLVFREALRTRCLETSHIALSLSGPSVCFLGCGSVHLSRLQFLHWQHTMQFSSPDRLNENWESGLLLNSSSMIHHVGPVTQLIRAQFSHL